LKTFFYRDKKCLNELGSALGAQRVTTAVGFCLLLLGML
jgi:hypothetical protein